MWYEVNVAGINYYNKINSYRNCPHSEALLCLQCVPINNVLPSIYTQDSLSHDVYCDGHVTMLHNVTTWVKYI